jgi:hypothetical protein
MKNAEGRKGGNLALLDPTVSYPPTQSDVRAIPDKLDELINASNA